MNIAVIFAGGSGQRMKSKTLPKQFLKVHGKEILVHTIEKFQACDLIDAIIVVSIQEYKTFVEELKEKYKLTKIANIVNGGSCGQDSIYNGLMAAKAISISENDLILLHDGVRPVIDTLTIEANIKQAMLTGNAITVAKSVETVLISENDTIKEVCDRTKCFLGRAPQTFKLFELLSAHERARQMNKHDFIDSAAIMSYFGHQLYMVQGPANNIKITSPMDFFMFKAMLDAEEANQINLE